jgi:hypothetical protein
MAIPAQAYYLHTLMPGVIEKGLFREGLVGLVPKMKTLRMGKKNPEPLKANQEMSHWGNSGSGNCKKKERLLFVLRRGKGKTKGDTHTIAPYQKAILEEGKVSFLVNREGEFGGRHEIGGPAHGPAAHQRLLESFRTRKSVEWKESWKDSGISHSPDQHEAGLEDIFILTRRLLIQTVGPLNDRFIQDDSLLAKALGKVYERLSLPIPFSLWKKGYIQFILAHRDRLLP